MFMQGVLHELRPCCAIVSDSAMVVAAVLADFVLVVVLSLLRGFRLLRVLLVLVVLRLVLEVEELIGSTVSLLAPLLQTLLRHQMLLTLPLCFAAFRSLACLA